MRASFTFIDLFAGIGGDGSALPVVQRVCFAAWPGDVVAEVEVDKAVMEVQAGVRGRVVKVLVRPGDVVGPGAALVVVEPGC